MPDQASTISSEVDLLYTFLVGMTLFFVGLIFLMVAIFAIRYRRRSSDEIPRPNFGSLRLEIVWSVIPLLISIGIFIWSASVFFDIQRVPANAMQVYGVGKQWMWKFQHPEGNREINELHVPAGRPVKITLTSEDVIHSFFVPAFRIKQDALPGRYTTTWFQATKPGTYHLFCAEYCGTQHSGMRGSVVVMEPAQYEAWLSGDASGGSMAARGEKLFNQLGCVTCHLPDGSGRCPSLVNVYGKSVKLITGEELVANDEYIRESVLHPNAKIVDAYQPIMPTYQGQVSEEGVLQLIAYIKSISSQVTEGTAAPGTTTPGTALPGATTPGAGTGTGTGTGPTPPGGAGSTNQSTPGGASAPNGINRSGQ